jgi:uncharacterized OB-fold protein
MTTEHPVPVTDDPDTRGFFEAANRHRLAVEQCVQCEAFIHLPAAYCHHCGSWETRWTEVAARGSIYSWTVTERQARAAFPAPYTVAIIELDEAPGVRLIGHLPGRPRLAVGTPMIAEFELVGGVVLPRWRMLHEDHEPRQA